MNKRERMYKRIEKHGNDLLVIYPNARLQNPVALCKALRKFELQATRMTTALCNGVPEVTQTAYEARLNCLHCKVCNLLNVERFDKNIFINRDPRGYALKLSEEFAQDKQIYKDWGGYGILAPDFGGEV